jgi:hypothetical protein
MQLVNSARTGVRLPAATFTALCGAATAVGGVLTWLNARGVRPSMGMDHTSLARMLSSFAFAPGSPFWKSVGFAVLVLGVLMVIGALAGVRTLTVVTALLALGAAGMWIGVVVRHYSTVKLPNAHYVDPANLPWTDLRAGAWLTIVGAVLGLVSAFLLRRRLAAASA